MTADDQFCLECGIHRDLHDAPDECDNARTRVEFLEEMERMMFGLGGRLK